MKLLFVLFLLIAVLSLGLFATEAFQSAGTLLQLQTSHVPTYEDVVERRRLRRQIHRELVDLTGSE